MPRRVWCVLLAPLAACTSFATLRSAEVRPGPAFTVQAALAFAPGDEAGWFWSLDCEINCDHGVPGLDLSLAFGSRPSSAGIPYALGFGFNGIYPYLEGYFQLHRGRALPFGLGARLGIPASGWSEHQLYGRLDVTLGTGARLLLDPGLFFHTGNSPNGQNPGTFVGFVQGVGLELSDGVLAITPGVSIVWGRAERHSYGEQIGPAYRAFAMASVGVTFLRKRG
jgi:hypothetical protein